MREPALPAVACISQNIQFHADSTQFADAAFELAIDGNRVSQELIWEL